MKKTNAVAERRYPLDGVATVQQAAEFLKCSTDSIYRRVSDGRISVGRRQPGEIVRIPWQQLHEIAGTN